MIKVIVLIFCSVLITGCSNTKNVMNEKNTEETMEQNSLSEKDFKCNIEIIDNAMPIISSDAESKKYMYAIVSLRPKSGKLQNNWRIKSFKVEDESYEKFDDHMLKGKDLAIYRNNVREIYKDLVAPVSIEIQFENDKGEILEYEINDLRIQVVE